MAYAKSCRVNRERFFGSAILRMYKMRCEGTHLVCNFLKRRMAAARRPRAMHACENFGASGTTYLGFEPPFWGVFGILWPSLGKAVFLCSQLTLGTEAAAQPFLQSCIAHSSTRHRDSAQDDGSSYTGEAQLCSPRSMGERTETAAVLDPRPVRPPYMSPALASSVSSSRCSLLPTPSGWYLSIIACISR